MNPTPLTYLDGETLISTVLPPIRFVVDKLLPQGLHILAGAPKVGKSWLALWLCLCVAKGEPVWNFPTLRGGVLYLCLEDSYSRIQNRLLDITDNAPADLYFATVSEKLHSGLEEQIEGFLGAHPDTALVVIDTLQRIRAVGNEANPYASDYRDLGVLKELADRNRIAILLIHHLRKLNDEDPMNMISGTTGISGATDTNLVLKKGKRSGSAATLYCTGRDIEYQELVLEFDQRRPCMEAGIQRGIHRRTGQNPGFSLCFPRGAPGIYRHRHRAGRGAGALLQRKNASQCADEAPAPPPRGAVPHGNCPPEQADS